MVFSLDRLLPWYGGRMESTGPSGTAMSAAVIANSWSFYAVWQSRSMDTSTATKKYKNHRCPVEIISPVVWLYCRFCLSLHDVEELLFERGIIVPSEAIRKWCRRFGQQYANELHRRRPRPGDRG